MPANKNALIRYKTIDRCLRNRYRRWTIDDLVEACSNALYDCEGIAGGVSLRTVQADVQMMRSDKLGYNAPIEVYDHKFYRYADPDYSITEMPLSPNDFEVMSEAVGMLRHLQDFDQFAGMGDVVSRLQDMLAVSHDHRRPYVHYDSVPNLKGLRMLSPLYRFIEHRQPLTIVYQSFKARRPSQFVMYPYLLKEFRNRWFLFASKASDMVLFNLALDRIISFEPADVPFRDNPLFDPEHFFDDVIGVTKNIGNAPRRIVFWASREQSQYIKTKPLHPSQKLESRSPDDGSCVFSIEVVINFELYSVLMSYGPGIRVISPQQVVSYMSDKLHEAAEGYDKLKIKNV